LSMQANPGEFQIDFLRVNSMFLFRVFLLTCPRDPKPKN